MSTARTEHLYREHERYVRAVCARMVGSADADDIVQEAFVRAMTRPPADATRPMRPWLVQVARNLAIDHLRRRRRVDNMGETEDLAPDDPTDEEPVESPEDVAGLRGQGAAAVLVACDALPPTERAVVVLRELLDLSCRETAGVLGLSEASVKVLHHRARKSLAARDTTAKPKSAASTSDALDRFVRWLATREIAGVPVRDQNSAGWEGTADPALSSAGVIEALASLHDALVDAARQSGDAGVLSRALTCRGNLHRYAGRREPALADLAEALTLARACGDGPLEVRVRGMLATAHLDASRTAETIAQLVAALGSPALAESGQEATLRCRLAEVLLIEGRLEEAHAELGRVDALLKTTDDLRSRVKALHQGGHEALLVDDFVAAVNLWTEALGIAERLGDRRAEAAVRCNLGIAWMALSDGDRAREELGKAIVMAREAGARQVEVRALANVAMVEQDERALVDAAIAYERSVTLAREIGDRRTEGVSTFNGAVCELLRGRPEAALAGIRDARAICDEAGHDVIRPIMDTFEAGARAVLDDPEAPALLERARKDCIRSNNAVLLRVVNLLEGIPEVHRGDLAAARARLHHAILRWPEVRAAAHLLENQLEDALDRRS